MKKLWLFLIFFLIIGCSKSINKEDIKYVELGSIGQDSNINIEIFDNRSYIYEIEIKYPANIVVTKNRIMPNSEFDTLTELIAKSDFFNLKDEYKSDEKEAYTLTVKTDKYSKSITFYKNSNAPQELLDVAGFIQKIVES